MSNYRLAYPVDRAESREISKQQWGVLINSIFPKALYPESILNAWDLAKVKKLDVFGGHIAIVKQRSQDSNGKWVDVETSWLTVKAQIHVAHRTGNFAGIDPIQFGPMKKFTYEGWTRDEGGRNNETALSLEVPEWATATVYRFVNGQRCAFSDTVFFSEMVSMNQKQNVPTYMWSKKPTLMLSKCAKAAALRLGFDECDYSAEEMEGQTIVPDVVPDASGQSVVMMGQPDVMTDAASKTTASAEIPETEADNYDPFKGASSVDSVQTFDQVPAPVLKWLQRTAHTAKTTSAYAEAIDLLRASQDQEFHEIGVKLINAVQTINNVRGGNKVWDFIEQARKSGGSAFDRAAQAMVDASTQSNLPKAVADAAVLFLQFLKVQKLAPIAA